MKSDKGERFVILVDTFGLIGTFLWSTWALHVLVTSRIIETPVLSMAAAFLVTQCLGVAFLLATSCACKWFQQRGRARAARVEPGIREYLAAHASGELRLAELGRKRWRRHDLDACMAEFLALTSGSSRDRLTELAGQLGLVKLWRRRYHSRNPVQRLAAIARLGTLAGPAGRDALLAALGDRDLAVQAEACRALIRGGEPSDLQRVFGFMLGQPLRVRIMVSAELRTHAFGFCERAIPAELVRGDAARIRAILEIAEGWRSALRLPELGNLLRHPRPEVRAAALRLAPFDSLLSGDGAWVLEALEDEDPEVRAAAAFAAGRMRLPASLPLLQRHLEDPAVEHAQLAARALSQLGPAGWEVLEQTVLRSDLPAAAMALEALERVKVSPDPALVC